MEILPIGTLVDVLYSKDCKEGIIIEYFPSLGCYNILRTEGKDPHKLYPPNSKFRIGINCVKSRIRMRGIVK